MAKRRKFTCAAVRIATRVPGFDAVTAVLGTVRTVAGGNTARRSVRCAERLGIGSEIAPLRSLSDDTISRASSGGRA